MISSYICISDFCLLGFFHKCDAMPTTCNFQFGVGTCISFAKDSQVCSRKWMAHGYILTAGGTVHACHEPGRVLQ